uniref:Golgi transport 1Ba n=1 Tax=Cynoglossus semilaevis TaxID=244447 RepID=A0A3P8WEX8_CYNSE
MISLTDSQSKNPGLTGFGVFFLFFGMILFFDKALLAIGNILFVAGLAFVIGLERTFRFFFQKHKMKATGFFLGGIFVVLIGWPIVGVVLEIYGFFLLFRGFFPVIVGFIRRIPVLGSILNLSFISAVSIRAPAHAAATEQSSDAETQAQHGSFTCSLFITGMPGITVSS